VLLSAGLYGARDRLGPSVGLSEFVDALIEAATRSAAPSLASIENWDSAKRRLTRLLEMETPLGISAKAMDVMSETERLYCRGRVVTDLRPIFAIDTEQPPVGVVILHSLRLNYHAGPEKDVAQFFVTLEPDDLKSLRALIDRAISKEASLREIAEQRGITCLNYKESQE
jgi:hypothetical protein